MGNNKKNGFFYLILEIRKKRIKKLEQENQFKKLCPNLILKDSSLYCKLKEEVCGIEEAAKRINGDLKADSTVLPDPFCNSNLKQYYNRHPDEEELEHPFRIRFDGREYIFNELRKKIYSGDPIK